MTIKNKKQIERILLRSTKQISVNRGKKFKFDLEGGLFEIEKRSTSV